MQELFSICDLSAIILFNAALEAVSHGKSSDCTPVLPPVVPLLLWRVYASSEVTMVAWKLAKEKMRKT